MHTEFIRENISWFWYEKKNIVFWVKIMEPNGQDFSSNIERKQLEFGFSLSISWVGGPFAIPISISPNSHLDFSEARLCNFPCNFSTLCPNDSKSPPSRKACTNPIEQEGWEGLGVSKIERAPINIQNSVAPSVQKVILSGFIDQKSNTTSTNTQKKNNNSWFPRNGQFWSKPLLCWWAGGKLGKLLRNHVPRYQSHSCSFFPTIQQIWWCWWCWWCWWWRWWWWWWWWWCWWICNMINLIHSFMQPDQPLYPLLAPFEIIIFQILFGHFTLLCLLYTYSIFLKPEFFYHINHKLTWLGDL